MMPYAFDVEKRTLDSIRVVEKGALSIKSNLVKQIYDLGVDYEKKFFVN